MCFPFKPYKIEREWTFAGLQCAVIMTREFAHRCGYVRVPAGHPLHGKEFMEDPGVDSLVAHGGVNFSEAEPCIHEDGTGWWFGFDCGHCEDAKRDPDSPPDPMFTKDFVEWSGDRLSYIDEFNRKGHYWTLEEVSVATETLALQLAALGCKNETEAAQLVEALRQSDDQRTTPKASGPSFAIQ
jgi:hypothetical protein